MDTPVTPTELLSTEVVGFDLGHGETALALSQVATTSEPQILDIQNQRSFITAVALHPKRGVIIGEDAYTARHLDSLHVRFKSAQVEKPEVAEPIKLFVRRIHELLQENGLIQGQPHTQFVVGCPSGWSPEMRQRYAKLMQAAGLNDVTIIAESRAAFIHAREASELRLSPERLHGTVLIVDVGSSTTDFTAVHNLHERYIDFGDVQLGAGLIDRSIFNWVLAKHPQREDLEAIFQRAPQYDALCELKCRTVKETFFSNEARWVDEAASDTLKLPSSPPLFFDVELTAKDMAEILRTPVLNGQDWLTAFRNALLHAREQMQDALPSLVFLTGGASRMEFTRELCQAIFPEADVVRGQEPELAIARGLARAGRIDRKARAFRQETHHFLESDELHRLVETRVPQLLKLVADTLLSTLPEAVILPTFEAWQRGEIKTLNDLQPSLEKRMEAWLSSAAGQKMLTPAVERWFRESIGPLLEQQLNPICDRYQIPRTAFNLQTQNHWRGQLPDGLLTDSNQVWHFMQGIDTITGLIISIVLANVAGGSGIALVMQGPVGMIIGFIVGLVAFAVSRKAAEHWLRSTDLYLFMRRLASVDRLQHKLEKNRPALYDSLISSLEQNSETVERITHDVSTSIQAQLNRAVEEVMVLIR